MDGQIFIVEYDLYSMNSIRNRDMYLQHKIEKRPTTKSFEDLLTRITNDMSVVQDSIRKYKAEEIV